MSIGGATFLIIAIAMSLSGASTVLRPSTDDELQYSPSLNYTVFQEPQQEEIKKSAIDAIQIRLDSMEKDMDGLKKENENLKSLVQHLQDLQHSGNSSSTSDSDTFPELINSLKNYLKKKFSGLDATYNASLSNVNKDVANVKVKMNIIEYVVEKLSGEVKELGQVQIRKRPSSKTPPSSCHELSVMGHQLDGLYAIKDKATKKLQAVYCQFAASVEQELIGTLQVKTKSVHFYVQRNTWYGEIGTAIPFEIERLNEGGAFDLKSGVFKAPVPGIYNFQFSGVKNGEGKSDHGKLSIFLQLNGARVGVAHTSELRESYGTVSLSASLRLKAGDAVYLNLYSGELYEHHTDHFTHFSGWLVEEDLL